MVFLNDADSAYIDILINDVIRNSVDKNDNPKN